MKTFIVFAAVIAVVASDAIGRVGWGAPSPAINLISEAALAAAGSGSANANQALQESALGGNASILSANGLFGGQQQSGDISQAHSANTHGQTSTAQVADVSNLSSAQDNATSAQQADGSTSFNDSGNTAADGEGALALVGATYNSVNNRKN